MWSSNQDTNSLLNQLIFYNKLGAIGLKEILWGVGVGVGVGAGVVGYVIRYQESYFLFQDYSI